MYDEDTADTVEIPDVTEWMELEDEDEVTDSLVRIPIRVRHGFSARAITHFVRRR